MKIILISLPLYAQCPCSANGVYSMRHYASSLGCNSTKSVQAIRENHMVSDCPIDSAHIASFVSSDSKIDKVNFGHPQSRFIPVCVGMLSVKRTYSMVNTSGLRSRVRSRSGQRSKYSVFTFWTLGPG